MISVFNFKMGVTVRFYFVRVVSVLGGWRNVLQSVIVGSNT